MRVLLRLPNLVLRTDLPESGEEPFESEADSPLVAAEFRVDLKPLRVALPLISLPFLRSRGT